jgi:hypothetical protein
MHFDPRTQEALRAVGLDDEAVREASDLVAAAVREDAADIAAFFSGHGRVYSDMDLAHASGDTVDHFDYYTHGADLRGYLRFDSWGVPVEGGRVLSESVVEVTLGPTVHDRVRFAADPDEL